MKHYQLGEKKIYTTEKRYNAEFKALGYVPVEEVKPKSKPKKLQEEKPTEVE